MITYAGMKFSFVYKLSQLYILFAYLLLISFQRGIQATYQNMQVIQGDLLNKRKTSGRAVKYNIMES
jgi:hypothetical protein